MVLKAGNIWKMFKTVIILSGVIILLLPVIYNNFPWPSAARNYMEMFGTFESGARNLVSAIYLGYRAFDTLGETLILLVAVSGTISIIAYSGIKFAKGYGKKITVSNSKIAVRNIDNFQHKLKHDRTELMDVVTGKIGPVVLLFGLYVMLFGHLSPGGGFQGGVVVASGIVFIALGSKAESNTHLTKAVILGRIEAAAFLCMILAALSGIIFGKGFFGNPLNDKDIPHEGFIILLNIIIGLKVGTGIGFMCMAMLGRGEE